jgi:hypothetical protein
MMAVEISKPDHMITDQWPNFCYVGGEVVVQGLYGVLPFAVVIDVKDCAFAEGS